MPHAIPAHCSPEEVFTFLQNSNTSPSKNNLTTCYPSMAMLECLRRILTICSISALGSPYLRRPCSQCTLSAETLTVSKCTRPLKKNTLLPSDALLVSYRDAQQRVVPLAPSTIHLPMSHRLILDTVLCSSAQNALFSAQKSNDHAHPGALQPTHTCAPETKRAKIPGVAHLCTRFPLCFVFPPSIVRVACNIYLIILGLSSSLLELRSGANELKFGASEF